MSSIILSFCFIKTSSDPSPFMPEILSLINIWGILIYRFWAKVDLENYIGPTSIEKTLNYNVSFFYSFFKTANYVFSSMSVLIEDTIYF
jgi:hypothetical protein